VPADRPGKPKAVQLPLEPRRTAGQGKPDRPDQIPKVVAPPEATGDALSHDDFVDLIDHISRSEERKGLTVSEEEDEEN
jgi:hypothetical protein